MKSKNRVGEWIGPFPIFALDREKKLVFLQESKIGAARPFSQGMVKPYLSPDDASHVLFQQLGHSLSSRYSHHTLLTDSLKRGDPRCLSPQMSNAKCTEIHQLIRRGTFKVILKEEIPPNANVLSARFVLSIRSTVDYKVKWKACYVAGGHMDKLKKLLVHSSQSS